MSYFSRYIRLPQRPPEIRYLVFTNQPHEFDNQEDFEDFLLENADGIIYLTTPEMDRFEWLGERPLGELITSIRGLQSYNRSTRTWPI